MHVWLMYRAPYEKCLVELQPLFHCIHWCLVLSPRDVSSVPATILCLQKYLIEQLAGPDLPPYFSTSLCLPVFLCHSLSHTHTGLSHTHFFVPGQTRCGALSHWPQTKGLFDQHLFLRQSRMQEIRFTKQKASRGTEQA